MEKEIRIAVGFFTICGYNLIRRSAEGKELSILAGVRNQGKKKVDMAIIKEITADPRRRVNADRYAAGQELVEKIKGGRFRIVDARTLPHHAKSCLIDKKVALVDSSNLSQQGSIGF